MKVNTDKNLKFNLPAVAKATAFAGGSVKYKVKVSLA